MPNATSCPGGRWCERADALLGVEGIHVCSVTAAGTGLVLHVETAETISGCPDCGVVAVGHGRRHVRLHDTPCFGRPVRLLWAKRVWRCPDPDCPRTTFTEEHELAGPRAKLTARAVAWATDGLQRFDTSVSALAHQLGVSWHTAWDAIKAEATRRIATAGRLRGVNALGVDEHVWSHTGPPGSGMVTGIVDHTRDAQGVVHARLLDLVPGRSRKAYADWLKERGAGFTAGIKTAALDPFRGYANAVRDELPEAITVLDAFHVVKLGSAMVDEVRRRVQQDTLGHRGRKGDPLYGIRRTLQIGAEHLNDKQAARLDAKLNRPVKLPGDGQQICPLKVSAGLAIVGSY
jgi:transposase